MPGKGRPFKKGKSGNPKGRPKAEWSWAGLLKEVMEQQAVTKGGKKLGQKKKLIAEALVRESAKGNTQAIKILMDRMDGYPVQDLTSDGDKIESTVVYMPAKKDESMETISKTGKSTRKT